MLRSQFLIKIFIAAVLSAFALLIYLYIFVHPAYRELLIENAEDEGIRFASFLVASQKIDQPISRINIPPEISSEVGRLRGDELLVKLRIFSPAGEIVYSTVPEEIGTFNTNAYFHEKVAKGQIYSKTVKKNSATAERVIVSKDLVETYVPIMNGESFIGAIETYYDITASNQEINTLTQHSLALLASLSLVLLSLLYYALHHADLSIRGKEKAEKALKQINEDLELRVAERAGELLVANTNLTREIAERTIAQMALSEALDEMRSDKEKISGILSSVNDGLLVTDSDNCIVMLNEQAGKVLNMTPDECIGKPLSQAIPDPNLYNAFSTLLTNESAPHIDFKSLSSETHLADIFQARASQLRDEINTVKGTIVLMQNVTQERRIEQMKSDFLAMAAHELTTPLATIIGYAELLAGEHVEDLSREVQLESLKFIHDKANHLSLIIDDLLDVSRAEAGLELSINKITFDLNHSLKIAIKNYSETNSNHTIVFKQSDQDGIIQADPTRIGQVLDNLISNALKYTPHGGHIQISNWQDAGTHHVEISDDGVGMTPDQRKHVFDKFYRADASNTAKPGIGLGMSITKHIIEGHGGTITVNSEPNCGTRVVFSLPAF